MTTNQEEKLKKDYFDSINAYAKAFCKKQDLYLDFERGLDYWIGGYILRVSDYFINISDIMLDIDKGMKKGVFFEWYDESLERRLNGELKDIAYIQYCKGERW